MFTAFLKENVGLQTNIINKFLIQVIQENLDLSIYRVAKKTGPPSHCKYSEIP